MKQLLTTLRRTWRRWRRIRHRCGYGIHSPFAFGLVTGVIYEREAYYAYAPLHALRPQHTEALCERDDQLLFRLINYHQPRSCFVVGAHAELTMQYLKAGCCNCSFHHTDGAEALCEQHPTQFPPETDMLCLIGCDTWTEWAERALQSDGSRCMIVISDIDADKGHAWQHIIKNTRVRISFNLGHIGILCCEKRLNKQDFIIRY